MRVTLLLLAACGSTTPGAEAVTVENSGRACLYANPLGAGAQTFEPDAPLNVVYTSWGTCLSSNCTRDRSATCSIARMGTSIVVSSEARWVDASEEQGNACHADCVMMDADCSTEALPAGIYELGFGSTTLTLAVPSQHAEPPCVDSDVEASR